MTRPLLLCLTLLPLAAMENSHEEITQYGPWKGRWVKARLSAYSPHDRIDAAYHATKGDRWRWITADARTDVRAVPYGIAAPSSIPFGRRIFVPVGLSYLDHSRSAPHQRVFTVDDRGAAIEGGIQSGGGILRLDLRYRTEYSALAFGVKEAWVFVIQD